MVEIDQLEQTDFDLNNALSPARQHVNTVLAKAAARLPHNKVTVTLAHGRNIEEAVDGIGWKSGELVIVGSSRLAENRKIFLGSTANKILRSLPVPMVVVPRDFQAQGSNGAVVHQSGGYRPVGRGRPWGLLDVAYDMLCDRRLTAPGRRR